MDLELITTFPKDLRSEWNSLLAESIEHVPFLRHEYLETWWQTRGGGEWPAESQLIVVTGRENGRLAAIAPLFYTPEWQGKSCLMLLGSHEVSDYLDFIAKHQTLDGFLEALMPFLTKTAGIPAWERLDIYNLLDSSPSIAALQKAAGQQGWKQEVEQLQHSPYIPLPGDWETYLAGIDKKQRHEIRRKMRRAETAEQGIRWYLAADGDALDGEIEAFMQLMEQDPDKARFLTPAMREHMRLTVRCAFEAGCLNLAFLEIGGKKSAGYLSFDYLNRLWVYNSGIDRSFNEFSPGWVLLGNLLQWANEKGRAAFDFMRGDEDYKYRFGAVDRFVMRVKIDR